MTIGEQIRAIRKYCELTQKELASLSNIAVVTLQQYESGKRQPRLEQLQKIASVFGGSVEDIFELEKPELCFDPFNTKVSKLFSGDNNSDYIKNKEKRIINEFNKLNDMGKKEALKRVEELTEIPKYKKVIELLSGVEAVKKDLGLDGNMTSFIELKADIGEDQD